MLELPKALRSEFKEPFGPVYTDAETLLDDADGPFVAVGDVVTAHLLRAGRTPALSVIDGRTKREEIDDGTAAALERLPDGTEIRNPAGVLTEEFLRTLADAVHSLDASAPQVLDVDGEEDLATLPVVVAAANGTNVVYGQPDEGMVLVRVTAETRAEMQDLLRQFDGDVDAAFEILDDVV